MNLQQQLEQARAALVGKQVLITGGGIRLAAAGICEQIREGTEPGQVWVILDGPRYFSLMLENVTDTGIAGHCQLAGDSFIRSVEVKAELPQVTDRYGLLSEASGFYRAPDAAYAGVPEELREQVAQADGIDLLRAFECLLRGETGPNSYPITQLRRELQLRLGLIVPDAFSRLLVAAEIEGQGDLREGARLVLQAGEPRCPSCRANQIDWPGCVTSVPCPKCGGPVHAADGEWACEGYYTIPRRCNYRGSADDQLREYEGADSPAGVRYHEGPEIDRSGDFE